MCVSVCVSTFRVFMPVTVCLHVHEYLVGVSFFSVLRAFLCVTVLLHVCEAKRVD